MLLYPTRVVRQRGKVVSADLVAHKRILLSGMKIPQRVLHCGAMALAMFFCCVPVAMPQDRLDVPGMGMGRASVSITRGLNSIYSNPGLLDAPPLLPTQLNQPLTFSIYTGGGTIGATYLSGDEFRTIFAQKPEGYTKEDRERVGQLLQDERLYANAAINLIAIRYRTESGGTWAFHHGHRVFARMNFPESFSEIVATSNITGRDYTFINRGIGGDWLTEFGLSYGKMLEGSGAWFPRVGIGATAKLIQGVAHFEVAENSIITIQQVVIGGAGGYNIKGGYQFRSASPNGFNPAEAITTLFTGLFPATAGTGFGFDLGVGGTLYSVAGTGQSKERRDAVFFGMALQDVGSVNWNTETLVRSAVGINDTLGSGNLDNNQFRRYEGKLAAVPAYSTSFPTVFRAGVGVDMQAFIPEMDNRMTLNIEGEAPLNDPPGSAARGRFAVGGEYGANDWLTVRTGFSGFGINGFGWGIGATVRPTEWLTFEAGSSEFEGLFGNERIDAAARLSIGWVW